ncbi:hypothetical protein [Enterovibrio coralii]|uniref:DNA mismatch repair protein n=1 Tax=Enterovibrio coralii TaxID=294935 RepID=A0A135IA90_9GAMM|nr:hypothetical protein [Enterovibrio coralii]KXF82376.1 hypothetical protein ATN88_09565 [Enterovibrio coralii]
MRITIKTWLIVATGLVLNIVAALMTNFVIDDLGEEVALVAEKQFGNNQLIQLTWQQVDALERRRETLLIVMALKPLDDQVSFDIGTRLLDAFGEMVNTPLTQQNLPKIMLKIDQQQDLLREKIDSLYLDNLQLAESQRELNSKTSAYRNLALFLQVLGLALIMARDLSRRQD